MRLLRWLRNLFAKFTTHIPTTTTDQTDNTLPEPVVSVPDAPALNNKGTPANPNYTYLWTVMELSRTSYWGAKVEDHIGLVVAVIMKYKHKYESVARKLRVPWQIVACLHYREASLDFNTCLHNGDPLPGPTRHVPKGRGPFASWEEAAIDALNYDRIPARAAGIELNDWPRWLALCEAYNGMGYRRTGIYSPYVWAGSSHYPGKGKYVADGKLDMQAVEKQLGVAVILRALLQAEVSASLAAS